MSIQRSARLQLEESKCVRTVSIVGPYILKSTMSSRAEYCKSLYSHYIGSRAPLCLLVFPDEHLIAVATDSDELVHEQPTAIWFLSFFRVTGDCHEFVETVTREVQRS